MKVIKGSPLAEVEDSCAGAYLKEALVILDLETPLRPEVGEEISTEARSIGSKQSTSSSIFIWMKKCTSDQKQL